MNNLLNRAFYPVLAFLFLFFAFLLFKNLGHYPFWDDEANTAIFARNLLSTGELTAFDGRNLAAYSNGTELNTSLQNTLIPPLQYYFTAISFKLFGEGNFAARFPFALLGLLSFIIFFLINKELSDKKMLILFNMVIFATNVAFILFLRQCRYFASTTFFFLLCVHLLVRFYKKQKNGFLIGYLLSAIMLFLSQYNAAISIMAVFLVSFAILKRWNIRDRELQRLFLAHLPLGLFIIGYFYFRNPFDTIASYPGNLSNIGFKFYVFYRTLLTFDAQTFLSFLLLFLYIIIHRKTKGELSSELKQLFYFLLISIAGFSLLAMKFAIRYVIYLAPVAFAIEGNIIYQISQWPIKYAKFLSATMMILLVFTSSLFVSSEREGRIEHSNIPVNFHFFKYIDEISSENPTTYSELIDYFESKKDTNKTLLFYPRFMTFPLMYYLGDQYLFSNLIDHQSKINKALPSYLYNAYRSPDYIVICGPDAASKEEILKSQPGSYGYVQDTTLNFYYRDMTRPEYHWRSFDVVTDFDRENESIFIYRRYKTDTITSKDKRELMRL